MPSLFLFGDYLSRSNIVYGKVLRSDVHTRYYKLFIKDDSTPHRGFIIFVLLMYVTFYIHGAVTGKVSPIMYIVLHSTFPKLAHTQT